MGPNHPHPTRQPGLSPSFPVSPPERAGRRGETHGLKSGLWLWILVCTGAGAAEIAKGCDEWMRAFLENPGRDESALLAWVPGEGDCLPEQEHEILTVQGSLFLREGMPDLAMAAWAASLERPGPHREENLRRIRALKQSGGRSVAMEQGFTAWLTGQQRVSAEDAPHWKEAFGKAVHPPTPETWQLRSSHAFAFAEQPNYRRSGFYHHASLEREAPWPWRAAKPSLEGRGRFSHSLQPLGWEGWQATAAATLPIGPWFLDGEVGGGWDEASGGNDPDLRQSGPFAPGWVGLVYGLHGLWLPRAEWRGWQGWLWGGVDQFREGWRSWSVSASLQKNLGSGVVAGILGREDHRLQAADSAMPSLQGFSVWSAEAEWVVKRAQWNLAFRAGARFHDDRWDAVPMDGGIAVGEPPAGRRSAEGGLTLKVPGGGAWSWEGSVRGGYEWSGGQGGPMAGARLRLRFREGFR